jgi:geranylgeranyl diphosphate synthase, type I
MEQPKLRRACEHYVENWHDFYHAGLFSMSCEAVGGNPDDFLQAQAAIAILAASFDLHDDILDKSEMSKYEAPTVYGKFGLEIALLLGDACLIEGFKLLVDSLAIFPDEKKEKVLKSFKDLLFDVGNAHSFEVCSRLDANASPDDYLKIAKLKGGSMEAFLMLGALFGGGNEAEVASFARFGRIIGILVTLRDDLVDVFDVQELRQRVAVKDLPMPLVFALQDDKVNAKISDILSKSVIEENEVDELVNFTLNSKSAAKLKYEMQLLIEEGISLINKLSKKKLQRSLQALVTVMLEDLQPS